jgi:hypothetical protein
MGKGSNRRPTDEQKFQDNYDLIFGKKDKQKKEEPKDDKRQ